MMADSTYHLNQFHYLKILLDHQEQDLFIVIIHHTYIGSQGVSQIVKEIRRNKTGSYRPAMREEKEERKEKTGKSREKENGVRELRGGVKKKIN